MKYCATCHKDGAEQKNMPACPAEHFDRHRVDRSYMNPPLYPPEEKLKAAQRERNGGNPLNRADRRRQR